MSAQIQPTYSSTIPPEKMAITPAAGEQLAELFGEVEDDEIEAMEAEESLADERGDDAETRKEAS